MKWLLVTTSPSPHAPNSTHANGAGWNIGDVFARIGTEQVIREVDPSAEFDLLNMDSHESITTERPFDRCVMAGRPAFWAKCETHPLWTHVINGWPGRDPKKICALGVGDCYALPRDDAHLRERLADLKAKTWGASIRMAFDTDDARLGVCPASWVLLDRPEKPTRKLCNFMLNGGHYPAVAEREAWVWSEIGCVFIRELRDRGFWYVAHTEQECEAAIIAGFKDDRIIFADTIEPYLDAYASASHYFGNRMHGAVVLAGRMARAMAVGYDSRLDMVLRAGCVGKKPSQLSLQDVIDFAEEEVDESDTVRNKWRVNMIRACRTHAVRMIEKFAR